MKIKSITIVILLSLLVMACDDDEKNYLNYQIGTNPSWGVMNQDNTGSVTMPSGDFSSFDITVNDFDSFADAEDVVITDKNHDHFEDYVENSSFDKRVTISYNEESLNVETVDGVEIETNGCYVTVNSTVSKVEYVVSGNTSNGGLKIYSEKKFKLTLDGASITSQRGAAINIQSGKRVFVELTDGKSNRLEDAAKYTDTPDDEDEKATFFSEGQLIFNGNGSLEVTGKHKHAICSDDYLFVRPGVKLSVPSASSDAVHTNDGIFICGGELNLTPDGDGLDTDGVIAVSGGLIKVQIAGDGKKAIKAAGNINIQGGNVVAVNSADAVYEDDDITSTSCLKSDSHISISDGNVSLKATGKAGKGISCDSTFVLSGGVLKVITTGKQYVVGSVDSSPKGIKAEGNVTINGGLLWVRATGGEGSESLESKNIITMNEGEVVLYGYDDCMNAKKNITFNGGRVYCISTGNDGIDSNGTINVNGGLVISCGTMQPEEGFDCDQNTFTVIGGTILGVGGATSFPSSNVCKQNCLVYGGSGNQGNRLSICNSKGNLIMSFVLPRSYSQMTVLFSSPDLGKGDYSISSGGTLADSNAYYDFAQSGTLSDQTTLTSFSVSNVLTQVGNVSSMGGPGGAPGGGARW